MAAVLLIVCFAFVVWVCFFLRDVQADSVRYPSSCTTLGSFVDCSNDSGLSEVPIGIPGWVTRLELQSNGIKEIKADDFKGLLNLTYLGLSHNNIDAIHVSAFRDLKNLITLDLSHNYINIISGSRFKDLKKLLTLTLDYNQLTEIPYFPERLNITWLTMSHNYATEITVEVMGQMPELVTADLSNNHILGISNGSFQAGSKLTYLNLNNNKIMAVDRGSMNNLTHLEKLKMNKNALEELPPRVFNKLISLTDLELMRNKIQVIRSLTFDGMKELKTLKLKRNNIADLKDGAFWKLPKLVTLQMDYNNIANVTKGWPFKLISLKQLSLAHNKISKIEPEAWSPCKNLEKLDLSHNRLAAITDSSLTYLISLKTLNLDHNRISRIDEGAFRNLDKLSVLEMNSNKISWAMGDVAGAFRDLSGLTKLGLRHNSIRSIAVHAFSGLQRLRRLYLGENNITSIQENAFETLRELVELKFNSSKLMCDCHLAWLPHWLQIAGFNQSAIGTCFYPPLLRGAMLYQINKGDFKCNNEFPKPVIVQSPRSVNGSKGENMTLTCVTAINGDTQPNIHWKKNNIVLADSMSTVTGRSDGDIKRYTSHMHLVDIDDSMAGRYQCVVVSHEFGSVFSQRAFVKVYVYPVFLKTPKDVTVQVGKPAELKCAADGQPTPVISWQKDGGDNFPAARDRRMHVYPNDDRFYIMNTQVADEGVYSCFAKNDAGTIVTNVTVTVLETPYFVQPMQLKRSTKHGETTVLQCLASGSPQPKLTWLKDDKEFVMTPRHFFTVNNHILVIVDTQWADAAVYSCRMSNSLGTAKGATELEVLSSPGEAAEVSGNSFGLDNEWTTTGIIIIAVVCCVVGTSLVWVIIIYQTRKRHEMYIATPTDETTLPGEAPSSGYMSSDKEGSYSQGPVTMAGYHYQDYQMKESGYESSSGQFRSNGYLRPPIFPSDVDEDENQPPTLTAGDKLLRQMKEASGTCLQYAASDGDTIGSHHSMSSGQHSGSSNLSIHSGQWSACPQLQVVTGGGHQHTDYHHHSPHASPASDDPPVYPSQSSPHHLLFPEGSKPLLQTFHPTKSLHQSSSTKSGIRGSRRDGSKRYMTSGGAERLRHHSDSCDKRDLESPQYHCIACLQAQSTGSNSDQGRLNVHAEIHCQNDHSLCFHQDTSGGDNTHNKNKCFTSDSNPPVYHEPPPTYPASSQMGHHQHSADSRNRQPPHPNSWTIKASTHKLSRCICGGGDSPEPAVCPQHMGEEIVHCAECEGSSSKRSTTVAGAPGPRQRILMPCCCEVLRDSCYCPTSRKVDSHSHPHHHHHHWHRLQQPPPNSHNPPVRIFRSRSSKSIGSDHLYCPHCDTCPPQLKDCNACRCPSTGLSDQRNCPEYVAVQDRGISLSERAHCQGKKSHTLGRRSPSDSRLPAVLNSLSSSIPASATAAPSSNTSSSSTTPLSSSSSHNISHQLRNLPNSDSMTINL